MNTQEYLERAQRESERHRRLVTEMEVRKARIENTVTATIQLAAAYNSYTCLSLFYAALNPRL